MGSARSFTGSVSTPQKKTLHVQSHDLFCRMRKWGDLIQGHFYWTVFYWTLFMPKDFVIMSQHHCHSFWFQESPCIPQFDCWNKSTGSSSPNSLSARLPAQIRPTYMYMYMYIIILTGWLRLGQVRKKIRGAISAILDTSLTEIGKFLSLVFGIFFVCFSS